MPNGIETVKEEQVKNMKKKLLVLITLALIGFLSSCVEISLSEVESIHVNWQPKDAYLVDEEVVLDDIRLTAYFDDGSDEEFSLANSDVSLRNGYYEENNEILLDTRAHGDYDIRVSYQSVSVTLSFSVYDAIVTTEGAYYPNPAEGEHLYQLGDTIQDAIDNTPAEGAWVYVLAGEYVYDPAGTKEGIYTSNKTRLLEIGTKPVVLRGNDSVLNATSMVDYMIHVVNPISGSSSVTIDGFVIGNQWSGAAITQDKSQRLTSIHVQNSMMYAVSYTENIAGNTIQIFTDDSTVINNIIYITDTLSAQYASSGLYVDASNVHIKENTIIRENDDLGTKIGIIIVNNQPDHTNSNIRIEHNIITGGRRGIVTYQSYWSNENSIIQDLLIRNNTFINTTQSIVFDRYWSKNGSFENIEVANNLFINDVHEDLKPLTIFSNLYFVDSFNYLDFVEDNQFEIGDQVITASYIYDGEVATEYQVLVGDQD
jgi:hypothetical protein